MGKASKWIRNLLLGKREEKINKNDDTSSFSETTRTSTAIVPAPPAPAVEKRRWSFGRSSSSTRDKLSHKATRSFDSVITPQLVSQALLEYATLQQQQQQYRASTAIVVQPKLAATSTRPAAAPKRICALENEAATKIQACYRSYLARKALCALRGLVKLQALVRGHLVRKQTSAMVRCMNALMSIQVRARVQRIQMAEESNYLVTKTRKVHIEQTQEENMQLSTGSYGEIKDMRGRGGMIKSQNGHLNHPQTDTTIEPRFSTYSSGRISVSKREHYRQLYPYSSPSTHSSSRSYDQQVEGLSLTTTHTSSERNSSRDAMYVDNCTSPLSKLADLRRSYMANTESSKAKARSHSEPKQRPVKQKSRRTGSNEGITTGLAHNTFSDLGGNLQKNHNHWLVKLYRSSKSFKDIEFDTISTSTNRSAYCRTLLAYEELESMHPTIPYGIRVLLLRMCEVNGLKRQKLNDGRRKVKVECLSAPFLAP